MHEIVYTDTRGWHYRVGKMLNGKFRGVYQKPTEKRWRSMKLPMRSDFQLAQSDLDNYAISHKFTLI